MIGATGLGLLCFSLSNNLYSVILAVCLTGILCIPLSYYFCLKWTKDERIAALTSLFVSLNPTLIALSKVMIWDIFIIFFFLISGIIFISLKENPSILKGILLSLMLFLLFSFKLPNVLFAIVIYLFLIYCRGFSIKNSRDIIVSGIIYCLMLGSFFYSFPEALKPFLSGGGKDFFLKEDYLSILIATLKLIISPVSSPATSMAFPFDMGLNIFFLIGLVSVIPLIYYFKNIKKFEELFPLTILGVISLFYLNYGGWSHRYLTVPLFFSLFFVACGTIKINNRFNILAIVITGLCILSSICPSLIMVEDWNSKQSLAENHVATPLSIFRNSVYMAENEGIDIIASPYGRVFTFYYLSGNLNSKIVDFYEVDEYYVEQYIKNEIIKGKKIWYVEGWPDVFTFEGKDTISYKKMMEKSFLMETIYVSDEKIFLYDQTYPSLIIHKILDFE